MMRIGVSGVVRVAVVAGVSLWASPTLAAAIVTDATVTESVPAIATFETTGAQMSGMEVTLNFLGGGSETVDWETTGPTSGGAFGTGWSITEDGSTFNNDWLADFGTLSVLSMELNGQPGLTLFDLTFDGVEGTEGTELGRDFESSLADDDAVVATYSRVVEVDSLGAVGDIWNMLIVDFADVNQGEGVSGRFTFVQDTDNDARRVIDTPEPASLTLFGFGLIGLGAALRRRQV